MRRIRSKNMKPEVCVRRMLHVMGFRFRLHRRNLPGSPDIVLPCHKKIVLVHGCFWHLHPGCREGRIPETRRDYWGPKLTRNRERDARNLRALQDAGWKCLVVWECEVKRADELKQRIRAFMRR